MRVCQRKDSRRTQKSAYLANERVVFSIISHPLYFAEDIKTFLVKLIPSLCNLCFFSFALVVDLFALE